MTKKTAKRKVPAPVKAEVTSIIRVYATPEQKKFVQSHSGMHSESKFVQMLIQAEMDRVSASGIAEVQTEVNPKVTKLTKDKPLLEHFSKYLNRKVKSGDTELEPISKALRMFLKKQGE